LAVQILPQEEKKQALEAGSVGLRLPESKASRRSQGDVCIYFEEVDDADNAAIRIK